MESLKEAKEREILKKIDYSLLLKNIKEDPMSDYAIQKLKELNEERLKEFQNEVGIKERRKREFISVYERTLEELERFEKEIEKKDDKEIDRIADLWERGEELEEFEFINVNRDVAEFFLKKYIEYSQQPIKIPDVIRKNKIVNQKNYKKLIERLKKTKFAALLLLLEKCDGLEKELILKLLFPLMIQAGLGKEEIEKIVNILLPALEKGAIKGSKEFFRRFYKIVNHLMFFGAAGIGLLEKII